MSLKKRNKPGSWKRFKNKFIALKKYEGELRCEYCEVELDMTVDSTHPQSVTIDHIIPLSKGGKLKDRDNMVMACEDCNMKKADKLPETNEE